MAGDEGDGREGGFSVVVEDYVDEDEEAFVGRTPVQEERLEGRDPSKSYLIMTIEACMRLEKAGLGFSAWDLTHAQAFARVALLDRIHDESQVRDWEAGAMSQCTKEQTVRDWLAERSR